MIEGVVLIEYSKEGDFGLITLRNPPHNALEDPVFADPAELARFLEDPDLRGVVVRGHGRHFCGGADRDRLKQHLEDPDALAAGLDLGKGLLDTISFSTVPVVAAIRGQCLGAGLEIALACHFRVAAGGAMFGFPESSLGLMPGLSGTLADPGRLSRRALVDLVLTGRIVGAEEALDLGLVDRVVPGREVGDAALERLDKLTHDRPRNLIRAVMESVSNGRRMTREKALRRETELFCKVAREGG